MKKLARNLEKLFATHKTARNDGLLRKAASLTVAFALAFAVLLTPVALNSAPSAQAAQVNTQYSNYWWLRTPGHVSQGAGSVDVSSGGVYAGGGYVGNPFDSARPALFVSLTSFLPTHNELKIGVCSSATNSSTCVAAGNSSQFAFDVIGINKTADFPLQTGIQTKQGVCEMTDIDGYTGTNLTGDNATIGNTNAECPPNTAMLLLSNQSPTKPSNTAFDSSGASNSYVGSTLASAIDTFWSSASSAEIGAGVTLANASIPRTLAGGAGSDSGTDFCDADSCDTNSGFPNAIAGSALENQRMFPLSAKEAAVLRGLPQATIDGYDEIELPSPLVASIDYANEKLIDKANPSANEVQILDNHYYGYAVGTGTFANPTCTGSFTSDDLGSVFHINGFLTSVLDNTSVDTIKLVDCGTSASSTTAESTILTIGNLTRSTAPTGSGDAYTKTAATYTDEFDSVTVNTDSEWSVKSDSNCSTAYNGYTAGTGAVITSTVARTLCIRKKAVASTSFASVASEISVAAGSTDAHYSITDPETGSTVTAASRVFSSTDKLVVTSKEDTDDEFSALDTEIGEADNLYKLWDITLVDNNDDPIDPSVYANSLSVSIPNAGFKDAQSIYKLWHKHYCSSFDVANSSDTICCQGTADVDAYDAEELTSTRDGNDLHFTTTRLSLFGVSYAAVAGTNLGGNGQDSANSGDNAAGSATLEQVAQTGVASLQVLLPVLIALVGASVVSARKNWSKS